MVRVRVVRTNPGIEVEISDDALMKLFTDVAECQVAIKLLAGVMSVGFSILATLIVVL